MTRPPVELRNIPCDCPPDLCCRNCDPPSACVNRLTGDVRMYACAECRAGSWHHDGACLRCARRKEKAGAG